MGTAQSVTTDASFPDFVSVIIVWYAETFMGVAKTAHSRVAPGSIKMLTVDSMMAWYEEF